LPSKELAIYLSISFRVFVNPEDIFKQAKQHNSSIMAQHKAGTLKQTNKRHKTPGGTRPSRENALSGRTAGKERKTTKQRTNQQIGGWVSVASYLMGLLFNTLPLANKNE
jgi:hypothetical protein